MRKIFAIVCFLLMYGAAFGQLSQFRMIGSGSWSTVNDSTFSSTVTIQADLTSNGFLPTGITDSMLIFSQTGQRYTISSAINLTFSSADLTIVESGGDWGTPVGQVMIYEDNSRDAVPNIPFGATGATAKMQEAVDSYNSTLVIRNIVGRQELIDSTTNIRADFPTGGGDVTTAQLGDSTAAVRADFPSAADGTETIVTAGANINVSGDGSSATPYVITGTGSGGGGAGYIAQIHLDSFGAIPNDGLSDDVAIQQAIDTLIANNYHMITMSPGGVYDIESIEILGDVSDSTLVIWDLNGGTLQMTSQTTQTGNIYMRNADNYVFYNGTIAGEIDGSYAYDTNDVFLWWEQSSNITFHTIHFKAVSSHAFYGKNYDPTSGTEKRGAVWHNITLEGQNTDVDSFLQYSYIKYGEGAEYNIHSNIKKLGGYSLVRSEQGANDMWSNVIVLDSDIDNLSSSNKFETGIFYYAGISGGQNSGKLQLENIKINHVDNIVPIVVKGDDTKTNNIVQISNVHLLVNGVQGSLNTQIHLKDCPDAVLDKIVYRPRDQLEGSIIDLDNSSRTRIINSHIEDIGYALKLTNSDSIYLANNYFDVRDDIDPSSTGSAYYLSNEPNYSSVRAANADTYLAEGSRYSVTGEDVLLRKNSSATTASIDKPYLVFDDSTMISGVADASTEYMMRFDFEDLPSEWLQDTMRMEMRFRILSDSGATNQRFFWISGGTPRIQVQGRRDNTIQVTTVSTTGTTTDNVDGGVWQDSMWHILVISYKEDTLKTFIDGNLINNFEETAFRTDTLSISDWHIGGVGLNGTNGWNGEIDYWEINGDRYEFGTVEEPTTTYATTGTVSGSDYKPTRIFADDFSFTEENGRLNMALTGGDGDGLIDDLPNGDVSINGSGNDLNITNAGTVYFEATDIQLEGDLNLNQGSGTPTAGTGFTVGSVNVQRSAEIICLSGSVGASADDTAITGGTTVILTLPTGYRPANTLVQPAFTNQVSDSSPQMFAWEISTNGEMKVLFSEGATFDLDTAEVLYLSGCFSTN